MSFNWADAVVLGIIAVFAIIGLASGFILSIFRIASYFIAVVVSVKFYPKVAELIMKTSIYTNIKNGITENIRNIPALDAANLMPAGTGLIPEEFKNQLDSSVSTVVEGLNLPELLKSPVLEKFSQNISEIIDFNGIIESLGGSLAEVIVNIISLVLLFIAVRLGLAIFKFLLKGVAKLPVFKQLDKIGGLAFGALEGFLMVYVVLAILMLFQANQGFSDIFNTIDNSLVAKFFYQNNLIVNWMFPS
ncbi:MAG TPA: CvpA family protein [Clostridiaceae bacterium]|jgi:uncharacterized membrane protein required for colicin V production|nr:CvpA family protein [Clostridiaceae bacterium]